MRTNVLLRQRCGAPPVRLEVTARDVRSREGRNVLLVEEGTTVGIPLTIAEAETLIGQLSHAVDAWFDRLPTHDTGL